MRFKRNALALAIAAALASLLSACQTMPVLPETVTKIVEVERPFPSWATEPLPKPEPADGSVGARVESHDARGQVIDFANCQRKLLRKIEKGEAVQPSDCSP